MYNLAILNLILLDKRYRETPRRTWKTWLFDVSKQFCSLSLEHIVNFSISIYLSNKASSDECIWYFINCFADTTIGICLCFTMIKIIDIIVTKCRCIMLKSGLYYDIINDNNTIQYTIKPKMYFAQLFVWLGVIAIVQSGLVALNILGMKWIRKVGEFLSKIFSFNEILEIVMAMIIFPLIFNIIKVSVIVIIDMYSFGFMIIYLS